MNGSNSFKPLPEGVYALRYIIAIICFAVSGLLLSMTMFAFFFGDVESNNWYFIIFFLMPFVIIVATIGGIFFRAARQKTCPQCKRKIPHKSLQCGDCGYQFPEKPGSPFQPFYEK
jgi:prolipoprotein diacylglyceryltransferase